MEMEMKSKEAVLAKKAAKEALEKVALNWIRDRDRTTLPTMPFKQYFRISSEKGSIEAFDQLELMATQRHENERPISPSTTLTTPAREFDHLLRELNDRMQSLRRNVGTLAAELKEGRGRLALQQQACAKETLTRHEVEDKAKSMTVEMNRLQKSLEERNYELQSSTSTAEKYLMELDDLRSQLTITQAAADVSAASAESTQLQYKALLKELDDKNNSLQEQEGRINRIEEQLECLQKDFQTREFSERQLKGEVARVENEILQALARAEANKGGDVREILDEMSHNSYEEINKLLVSKDEEITQLRDKIEIMNAHLRLKTKEIESQLEKKRKTDQELRKRVLRLECSLQEARSQTRKLQRIGEQRDKAIEELKDQMATIQNQGASDSREKQNFWGSPRFKVLVSMSMLILIVYAKQ